MGLFEKIFNRKEIKFKEQTEFRLMNGYTPHFLHFRGSAYESDLIRASIDARARHIAKLKVEVMGAAKPSLQSKLRQGPNQWQTWSQFMYRLSTILDTKNNAIICPVFDDFGEISGIYSIAPNNIELVEYDGRPVIRVRFNNGKTGALLLSEVGIMTKFQNTNDLFGEDNHALKPVIELMSIQNQGIQEGVKNGATYRFMASMSNMTNDIDLAKEQKRFNENNLKSEGGGVLVFPSTYKDIKQINSQPYIPDAETMRQIETRVFDYFGVNEDVIQNKAYGDKWSAFYEGAIEPFAIQFSEVLSKMLFTINERARGSEIMATANRLQYLSNNEKLNISRELADRGILNRDEVREIWNLAPLPDGQGQEYIIRGEYMNASERINGEGENDEQNNQ